MSLQSELPPLVSAAIETALGAEFTGADPVLRPSQFSDIQVNAALGLAKRVDRAPRDIATDIVEHLATTGRSSTSRSAGRGFINLTLAGD